MNTSRDSLRVMVSVCAVTPPTGSPSSSATNAQNVVGVSNARR